MRTVEKIEVTKKPVFQKQKVAAYARISLETSRLKHSLSTQISYYNKLIQSNPTWEFAGIYADSGISGTSAKKRPQFQQMIQDCKDGKIDVILTKSIQRFARNTVDLLETVRELKAIGVEVRFEKENIHSLSSDGELMLSILASFAQEESRSISENVKWGTVKRFKQGIPNGKFSIYGYEWQGDQLVIIEKEAEVIRRIYAEYLSGKSRIQIEKMFAKEGIKTRRGYRWVDSNIKVILTNIHYTGNLLFQKEYVVDPISGKTRKNRGELPQYFIEDSHEAIISMEDFQKVQAEMERRRLAGAKGNPSIPTTMLTSKIKCPCCGKNFHSAVRSQKNGRAKTWMCANRKNGKPHHCQTGEIHDSIMKDILCEVLEVSELTEELVEEKLQHIDVIKKEKFVIRLRDGRVVEVSYKEKDRKAYYTKEVIEQLSKTRKNKHTFRRKHNATPFTGMIECGKCGNTFTSQKRIDYKGDEVVHLHCRSKKDICIGRNSIKLSQLEPMVCRALNIEIFDEETMDSKVERIYIANNKVTIRLKDGRVYEEGYINKRPFVPWSKERRKNHEAKIRGEKHG